MSVHDTPLSDEQLARVLAAANNRIERNLRLVEDLPGLPIDGPKWARRVVDDGYELTGYHRITGIEYPVSLHRDLSPGDAAVVIARRILQEGGTPEEAARFLRCFSLDKTAEHRLLGELETAS